MVKSWDTTNGMNTEKDASTDKLTYQVKLKVGEIYQLPYGLNYKYHPSQYSEGGPYLSVTNSGLVRALKYHRQFLVRLLVQLESYKKA